MKKFLSYMLVLVIMVMCAEDATAQRKKRRKSREKEEARDEFKKPWKQNMVYEIGFGNPSFLGGGGSSQFNIALKPGAGYKFNERLSAGGFVKWNYWFVNNFGNSENLHEYGVGAFARFKIIEALYLRGEYAFASYPFGITPTSVIYERENFLEPLAGLGYRSGFGDWVFGGEALFHFNGNLRTYTNQALEFWLKVDYNF